MDVRQLETLAERKWMDFNELTVSQLDRLCPEEGVSETISDAAHTWLYARGLWGDKAALPPEFVLQGYLKAEREDKTVVDQFRRIPAMIACCEVRRNRVEETDLVDKVDECLANSVWIRDGQSRGSWGYNVEVTRDLAMALMLFWQYAFLRKQIFEPIFENLKTSNNLRFNS